MLWLGSALVLDVKKSLIILYILILFHILINILIL